MATNIIIPRVGMAEADATIIEWKVKEGDWVEKQQLVVVLETEKVRTEAEAITSGFVHILMEEGATASAGQVIGLLAETKEELASLQKAAPAAAPAAVAEETKAAGPPETKAAPPEGGTAAEEATARVKISPVARKMAEEHAIDITSLTGTGPAGRIVREDIEKAIATREAAPSEVAAPAEAPAGKKVKTTIPLAGMRKTIAERMHQSLSVAAQLTAMGEIDMSQMVKLRQDLVARENVIGTRITYTDIFVFAVARALKDHPLINSSLAGNEIKVWEDINIGVAVALDEGLIVPVVKGADKKSLAEISKTVRTLVEKAREGKLTPGEVTGGTFTISNLDAMGSGYRFETVIINQPESAILGTGAITERAVVRDGQIVIRPIMTYYFTYDHRVIDGAVAAQFMAGVIELLENPRLLMV